MKTIAVLSSKGGCGKSTIALHLAVAYANAGLATAVIDVDPQASAAEWKDRREEDDPPVITAPPSRLAKELERIREAGGELVIIDTPPHNGEALATAARLADLVLIPCRPSIMDLNAITSTTIGLSGITVPSFVVLNAVPAFGGYAASAEEALTGLGIKVCPVRLGNRIAFSNALVEGKTAQELDPKGLAAVEAEQLYNFTNRFVGEVSQ